MAPPKQKQKRPAKPKAPAAPSTARPAPPTTRSNTAPPLAISQTRSKRQLQSLPFILIAGVGSYVSVLSLAPVYGGTPSALYHNHILGALLIGAWFTQYFVLKAWKPPSYLLPVMALYIPAILRYSARWSDQLGAVYGPIVTETITFYPLFILSILTVASISLEESSFPVLDAFAGVLPIGIFLYHLDTIIPHYLAPLIGSTWALTRCGLWHVIGGLYGLANLPRLPSWIVLASLLPAVWWNATQNTMCVLTPALNATLAEHNHTLIARQESLTGYISILDNTDINYRVLRCDHSLLGGEWQKAPKGYPWDPEKPFREPIYAIFVIMEAVRLVDPPPKGAEGKQKALAIGLGIGTSVDALIRHGIETDIVELDPVVYTYAMDYFSLSKNHTAYLEDAVEFVHREKYARKGQYDFVLHDVFTGGAVPAALFTRELLSGLEEMMSDDGVIAINWAGDLNIPESQTIMTTIQNVFRNCRSFREYADKAAGQKPEEDFVNMVTFCTTTRRVTPGLKFRTPTPEDMLGSITRRQMLMPKHEVHLPEIAANVKGGDADKGVVILEESNIGLMKKWQKNGAIGHWGLIRTVVPGRVWEEY